MAPAGIWISYVNMYRNKCYATRYAIPWLTAFSGFERQVRLMIQYLRAEARRRPGIFGVVDALGKINRAFTTKWDKAGDNVKRQPGRAITSGLMFEG